MSTFEGQVALVTGGASGIGRATALRLARDGASVAVLDRDGAGARAVAAEIGGPAFEVDVRDGDAVRAAVDATVDALGGLAILVNNAGVGDLRPLHTVDARLWHRIVDVNLTGTYHAMAAAIPAMLAGDGRDRQQRFGVGLGPDAWRGRLFGGEGRSDRAHVERCARVRADDPRQLRRSGLHPHAA